MIFIDFPSYKPPFIVDFPWLSHNQMVSTGDSGFATIHCLLDYSIQWSGGSGSERLGNSCMFPRNVPYQLGASWNYLEFLNNLTDII